MRANTRHTRTGPGAPFSPQAFFERWKVFTLDGLRAEHATTGASALATTKLVGEHVLAGHLLRLRRGLFAVPDCFEPHLVASLLTPDAVLAYDGALSFHGLSALGHGLSFLTYFRCRPFELDQVVYQAVSPARTLRRRRALVDGVEAHARLGRTVRVTSKERTLVDLLDRLDLLGDIAELAPLFRRALPLKVNAMVGHA